MHFSTSLAALLLAVPACLAAPGDISAIQSTRMVSYVAKDSNSGDLYFLCAGSQGNPTAVYRKTGKVEPACVFKWTYYSNRFTLESTYAKGTYLGRHGTDILSLGELGDNYWSDASYGPGNIDMEGASHVETVILGISGSLQSANPNLKAMSYPAPVADAKGDNQRVEITPKNPVENGNTSYLFEVTWDSDPTAANNPK
ncbi:MAG: hypothetical protein DHS80DRAFT_32907 [Piptocephalis tieghemiana]|nr:MAG: hypothetical protein DHS80DRAFT_32907 [Piptocephalis tieghemiana]